MGNTPSNAKPANATKPTNAVVANANAKPASTNGSTVVKGGSCALPLIGGRLEKKTVDDLKARAKKLNIKGRAGMNKAALVKAIRAKRA